MYVFRNTHKLLHIHMTSEHLSNSDEVSCLNVHENVKSLTDPYCKIKVYNLKTCI